MTDIKASKVSKAKKADKANSADSPSLEAVAKTLSGDNVELDDDECHQLATIVTGAAHRLAQVEQENSLLRSKLAIADCLPPEDTSQLDPATAGVRQQLAAVVDALSHWTRANVQGPTPPRSQTMDMPTAADIAEYARTGAPASLAGPGRSEFTYNVQALSDRFDPAEPNPVLRSLIAKRLFWLQTWSTKATSSEFYGFAAIQQQRPPVVLHPSLWKPIACGEFLDFGRLVDVANGNFRTAKQVIAFEDDAIINRSASDSVPVVDYRIWAACFSIYRTAVNFLYPERVTELQLYQQHFLEICGEFQFEECLAYDQYRRHLFALDPRVPLSMPQLHLHSKYLVSRLMTPSVDRKKRRPPADDAPICERFNNGRCRSSECKFKHACKRCGGNHPAKKCPDNKPKPSDTATEAAAVTGDQPSPTAATERR